MILFVDDEKLVMDSYVMELVLAGYDVSFKSDVDEALSFFENNVAQIELLILDIMMPPGVNFKEADTLGGLRTGVHFYEKVRNIAPECRIIILTNVSDPNVAARFEVENRCWFRRKVDYLPYELVAEIENILAQ